MSFTRFGFDAPAIQAESRGPDTPNAIGGIGRLVLAIPVLLCGTLVRELNRVAREFPAPCSLHPN
jgi:hypothetical protein